MTTASQAWATVRVRLGDLIDDPNPNVQANVAFLAGSLAETDADACRALARIALTAIEKLPTDWVNVTPVLNAALAEREALRSAELRGAFDDAVRGGLAGLLGALDREQILRRLLRFDNMPLGCLPLDMLATSMVGDAIRAANNRRRQAASEDVQQATERLRTIGVLLRRADRHLAGQLRQKLDGELEKLGKTSRVDRRLALLGLLRAVPELVGGNTGEDPIVTVTSAERRRSAAAARPPWWRVLWRAAIGGTAGGLVATLLMPGVLLLSPEGLGSDSVLAPIVGFSLLFGSIGCVAGLLVGVAYVPSLGAGKGLVNRWFGIAAASLLAWLYGALLAWSVSTLGGLYGYLHTNASGSEIMLLAFSFALIAGAQTLLTPVAASVGEADSETRGTIYPAMVVAGPPVGVVMVLAMLVSASGFPDVAQIWPILAAVAVAGAASLTYAETTATGRAVRASGARPRWFAAACAAGCALPVLLGLWGAGLAWAGGVGRSIAIQAGGGVPMQVSQNLYYKVKAAGALLVDFSFPPNTPSIPIEFDNRLRGVTFVTTPRSTRATLRAGDLVCFGTCAHITKWPDFQGWLPMLTGGVVQEPGPVADVTISAQAAVAVAGMAVSLSAANLGATVQDAVVNQLSLGEPRWVSLRLSDVNPQDAAPAMVVRDRDNRVVFDSAGQSDATSAGFVLDRGNYSVCAYASPWDAAACGTARPRTTVFVPFSARATVTLSDRTSQHVFAVPSDWSSPTYNVSYRVEIGAVAYLELKQHASVKLTADQDAGRVLQLYLYNEAGDHQLAKDTNKPSIARPLEPGRYQVCVAVDDATCPAAVKAGRTAPAAADKVDGVLVRAVITLQ